jgi:hypothetical protein
MTKLSSLLIGLCLVSIGHAAPLAGVENEINFLLGDIEQSGCEFFRNGTWHDAKAAQAHLRDKYNYLRSRNLINTTEDFIDKAATQSSFSGRPYQVRCDGGTVEMSSQWLRDELAKFRK